MKIQNIHHFTSSEEPITNIADDEPFENMYSPQEPYTLVNRNIQ